MLTSPGRRGLAHSLPEVFAQVRLVGEPAPQRNVTQGRIGRKHVLSGEFHATSHQENVRRLPEGALEGAGEVRLAAPNECAQIRDGYRTCNMTIDMVTHPARLPGKQSPSSIWSLLQCRGIDLLSQQ